MLFVTFFSSHACEDKSKYVMAKKWQDLKNFVTTPELRNKCSAPRSPSTTFHSRIYHTHEPCTVTLTFTHSSKATLTSFTAACPCETHYPNITSLTPIHLCLCFPLFPCVHPLLYLILCV